MNNKLPVRLWAIMAGAVAVSGAAIVRSGFAGRDSGFTVGPIPRAIRQNTPPTVKAGKHGADASAKDNVNIAFVTSQLLVRSHYLHHPLDNTISERLFDRFLDTLDPQRLYLLQADADEFAAQRDTLAQGLGNGDEAALSFPQRLFARYRERFDTQVSFVNEALKTRTFTYTGDDYYQLDRKKLPRPKDLDEARQLWWQRLRFEYLQEKLNKKKPDEIVSTITRRYSRLQKALKDEDQDEIFELYLDTLSHAFDPHSDYFGKASSESFGIQMKLSLYGIGAQLQSEDGYVKITSLVPGGPAFKSKKIKPGDRIVSVAQGTSGGEAVDVIDMNINKVVDMIRGPKGTTVQLTIIPGGATDLSTRTKVTLVRDEIRLEEQAAKAQLIEMPDAGGTPVRVGVIDLPSFYGGEGSNRSATEDVKKLLVKLKQEKVAGVILDLRRNGGGSLPEAIGMTGLFVRRGPVVQVRDSQGRVNVEKDNDPSIAWDGPLIVLTSRLSASASEIVAGALQDYGRAVIVGDSSTFGKGTVQAVVELQNILQQVNLTTTGDPGTLHLTIQQFFRPGGASTQLKGVVSDIVVPSVTSILDYGEKELQNPLPFDSIPASAFDRTNRVQPFVASLRERAEARIAKSPDFSFLRQQLVQAKKIQDDKRVSLNEAQRDKEKQLTSERQKAYNKELASRPAPNEKVYPITLADAGKAGLPAPLKMSKNGKTLASNNVKAGVTSSPDDSGDDEATALPGGAVAGSDPERDIVLNETKRILLDYVGLSHK